MDPPKVAQAAVPEMTAPVASNLSSGCPSVPPTLTKGFRIFPTLIPMPLLASVRKPMSSAFAREVDLAAGEEIEPVGSGDETRSRPERPTVEGGIEHGAVDPGLGVVVEARKNGIEELREEVVEPGTHPTVHDHSAGGLDSQRATQIRGDFPGVGAAALE